MIIANSFGRDCKPKNFQRSTFFRRSNFLEVLFWFLQLFCLKPEAQIWWHRTAVHYAVYRLYKQPSRSQMCALKKAIPTTGRLICHTQSYRRTLRSSLPVQTFDKRNSSRALCFGHCLVIKRQPRRCCSNFWPLLIGNKL